MVYQKAKLKWLFLLSDRFSQATRPIKKEDILSYDLPVGKYDRGYLSISRKHENVPNYFFDIGYQQIGKGIEKEIFVEIEKTLLDLGAWCCFSRYFSTQNKEVILNFYDKGGAEWTRVKLELDPEHVFTYDIVNSMFFNNEIKLELL